jgi:COP9 signalosome complex subunit 2
MSDDDWGDGGDGGFGSGNDDIGGGGFSDDDWGDGGGDGGFGSGNDDLNDFDDAGDLLGGGTEDPVIEYENAYYEAQDALEDEGDLEKSLSLFERVLAVEKEHGEQLERESDEPYGFMSLRQIVWILARLDTRTDGEVLERFTHMLHYLPRRVTIAKFEEAFYFLLDRLGSEFSRMDELLDRTLRAFKEAKQESARLRVLLRLARQLLLAQKWQKLAASLAELRAACWLDDGRLDEQRGVQLVEAIALEIQMREALGEEHALKALYAQATRVDTVVGPDVMAVVHRAGGKIHMREREWSAAFGCFSRAVKEFDEVGNQADCELALRYRLLAYMLDPQNTIDPFSEAQAKAYQDCESIVAMRDALDAHARYDIRRFKHALAVPSFAGEAFVASFRRELMATMHTRMIAKIALAYRRVRLQYIADELDIAIDEVERLLVVGILDKSLRGTIDQVHEVLDLSQHSSANAFSKYSALQSWSQRLHTANRALFERDDYP